MDSIPPRPLSTAAGVPVADVFLVRPLVLGEPNTLVCMAGNIFPPVVEISWQVGGVPVTQGVTHTHYTPAADLAFVRFSYLPVMSTPAWSPVKGTTPPSLTTEVSVGTGTGLLGRHRGWW